jgi:hypothetical protein
MILPLRLKKSLLSITTHALRLMLKVLASDDGKFWAIYDSLANHYSLVALDAMCPKTVVCTSHLGDRYQIKTGEHAMQMNLVGLSDVHLPTQQL